MMRTKLVKTVDKSVIVNTIVQSSVTLLQASSVVRVVMRVTWQETVLTDNVVLTGEMALAQLIAPLVVVPLPGELVLEMLLIVNMR